MTNKLEGSKKIKNQSHARPSIDSGRDARKPREGEKLHELSGRWREMEVCSGGADTLAFCLLIQLSGHM